MKYIDGDKLKDEIKNTIEAAKKEMKDRGIDSYSDSPYDEKIYARINSTIETCEDIIDTITTLQEEPAEWSEDEKVRKALLRCCDDWEKGQFGCMAQEDVPTIRAYLERQKKQQPKFNVGDTIRLKNSYAEYTIESISDGKYYCKGCSIDIDGGNRDYELVRQESAEWSEEDEIIANLIIRELEQNKKDAPEYSRHFTRLLNWFIYRFKSLRSQPHWKPSKEQMKALEYFIRSWGESGTMSPQNPALCAAKSLLNDLKKL